MAQMVEKFNISQKTMKFAKFRLTDLLKQLDVKDYYA